MRLGSIAERVFSPLHKHAQSGYSRPLRCTNSFIDRIEYSLFFREPSRMDTPPIKISSSYNGSTSQPQGRTHIPKQSGSSSFEDVKVDDSDDACNSPPQRNGNHVPTQHNLNQQMLLESMIDDSVDEDRTDRRRPTKHTQRPPLKHQPESRGVFLLLDANEHLTVSDTSASIASRDNKLQPSESPASKVTIASCLHEPVRRSCPFRLEFHREAIRSTSSRVCLPSAR